MRFLISGLGLDSGGGLTVGLNVARTIPLLARNHDYSLIFPAGCGYEDLPRGSRTKLCTIPVTPKALRRPYLDHQWLPKICREWKADAAFSMSNYGPWHLPCPHVLGLHKGHLLYPESEVNRLLPFMARMKLAAQQRYFNSQVRRIDNFCVLTDVLAERLSRLHTIPRSRIHVVPNAVAGEVSRAAGETPVLDAKLARFVDKFKLCYVAPFYPHKNHRVLIETLEHLSQDCGIDDVVVFVTIREEASGPSRQFLRDVRKSGLEHTMINLGYLSLDEVSRVYEASDALIMPSLLESFSNTYVEAMHHGLPILTSDMDFAHAVCGDDALYFDPKDPRSVAHAILSIRNSPSLAESLATRARQRLAVLSVSWENVTDGYIQAMETAAEQGKRNTR